MFQSFESTTSPETGAARLKDLREQLKKEGFDGFLIPRADAHQGEYVTDRDNRLAWLTGFTGSAGFCAALHDSAGVFIDGRYTLQAQTQVDLECFTPVSWPSTQLAEWLMEALPDGGKISFDPWLHTLSEIEKLRADLSKSLIELIPTDNFVDRIWADQPGRPSNPAFVYPKELAGVCDETKRTQIANVLKEAGHSCAILTQPDAICWLLNIRGADIPRVPIVQAFAIIHANGEIDLISDPEKFTDLGIDPNITLHRWDAFEDILITLSAPVRIDKTNTPIAVTDCLHTNGIAIAFDTDPCSLPKACKNETELAGAVQAHIRDGAAVCEFLAWLDAQSDPTKLTEIDIVKKLEGCRQDTGALKEISFDTICGSGPNGAIVHYRVNYDSNRTLQKNEVLLVDSGGQYLDGTTDITRTIAIGNAPKEAVHNATLVLKGMIAISLLRFPKGLSGKDIDALARAPLWAEGKDFDHGTGHGVGSYLSVHEGPQRISKASTVPLRVGMIVSNEPGYYKIDAYGIRIENLIYVKSASPMNGADDRDMMEFHTLTLIPFDKTMIEVDLLSNQEREWLNKYHQRVWNTLKDLTTDDTKIWLKNACLPL
ncbi:aminopeptidase P family protein [Amylibacter sp. SFDW26]|uniref:aminopeptidase P family protein n=1 Tax=Amylibacter sp. SFDW26 TaxID=2652722 RepID=UPI0012619475|nr:aminopeptidase P family protein [Amylibacter sp. SFDW26]KAB7610324.1 aminopeptidase P family protein [Amylibacter sp. SFDW26]